MWSVRQLTSRRTTLDFSSSGQPSREVTQIFADGLLFANAAELSSWNEKRIQLIVCEACGIERCQPGGWLEPRLAGSDVIFAPAFSDMLAGESERTEYAPPPYVADSGDGDRPFRPHRDHPFRAIAITRALTAGAVSPLLL
jgi:hypothetical protein